MGLAKEKGRAVGLSTQGKEGRGRGRKGEDGGEYSPRGHNTPNGIKKTKDLQLFHPYSDGKKKDYQKKNGWISHAGLSIT